MYWSYAASVQEKDGIIMVVSKKTLYYMNELEHIDSFSNASGCGYITTGRGWRGMLHWDIEKTRWRARILNIPFELYLKMGVVVDDI